MAHLGKQPFKVSLRRGAIRNVMAVVITASAPHTFTRAQSSPSDVPRHHLISSTTLEPFAAEADQVYESRANTSQANLQSHPCLAIDPTGNILVVWESRRQERGTYGVVAQSFDAWGRRIGTEFRINETVVGSQQEPAVAFDQHGTAWVAWESAPRPDHHTKIIFRMFRNEAGTLRAAGSEIEVNVTAARSCSDPSITINQNGIGLITWLENSATGGVDVRGRLFRTEDGTFLGSSLIVNDNPTGHDRLATVASCSNGRFMIAWDQVSKLGNPTGIFLRILNSENGTFDGPAINVLPSTPQRIHIEPALAFGTDASVGILTWMSTSDRGNGYDVMACQFNLDDQTWTDPFIVSEYRGRWQSGVAVAQHPDGRFIISYNVFAERAINENTAGDLDSKRSADIMACIYSADQRLLSQTIQINQTTTGKQLLTAGSNTPRIFWRRPDQLAVVWEGAVDGDHEGIGLTVFNLTTPPSPAPAAITAKPTSTELTVADVTPATAIPDPEENWIPQKRELFPTGVGPDYGFVGFTRTEWRPPDPDIAVGPDHLVATVNMRIAIFDKNGNELLHQYLEEFFAEVGADYFFVDPVTQYDHLANRFVVVSGEHEGGVKTKSRLLVAISKTSNPLEGWHFYRFNLEPSGDYFDFENLGIGTDAYYITSDYFDNRGSRLHILAKSPMLNGDPVELKVISITDSKSISLGPMDVRTADGSAFYLVTAFSGFRDRFQLYAVENAIGIPQITTAFLPLPEWISLPPDATQKGTTVLLPTLDYRIKHGIYRHGSLWLAQTVGEDDTARVRWYEIEMRGWPTSGQMPVVRQWGTLDLGVDQHNWFQDIGIDAQGDLVIACNRSSSNDYPFISRFVRKAHDPLGTFRAEVVMKESSGNYSGGRWGDYGSIDEDPAVPGIFWSHHEYNEGGGLNWLTWVGRIDTDQSLVLDASTLIRGEQAQLNIVGAASSKKIFLVYSLRGIGSTNVPALDITLDLQRPQLAFTGSTDSAGAKTFEFKVPTNAPLGDIWFQAAEYRNTSNVIETILN